MTTAKRILIMGLPGSGKTHFAQQLQTWLQLHAPVSIETLAARDIVPMHHRVTVDWFNADQVRQQFNDWDFSREGRIRQSLRMWQFACQCKGDYVICDFVAPLPEMRQNFQADWVIWMDTIQHSRYDDTNRAFVPPDVYDFRITEKNSDKWVPFVGNHIVSNQRRPKFDWQRETVQMLGRWQPWHDGHRALFERSIAKTGQVCIMIRDCQGWQGSNPFAIEQVKNYIRRDLDPVYQGQYEIVVVPNITNITYGRDVGYKIEKEEFDSAVTSISATAIRKSMGLQ